MPRTITLRLSDEAYEAVKHYADADNRSMNSWIESLLDVEDMRRRCAAHDRWMSAHPEAVTFAEAWADRSLDDMAQR
ncbi:MAG TPA: hypothetical protein VFD41_02470 [Actinomycetales bacterium]|nr:hypothetical protein [Actinomycetales bacterium]